MTSRILQNDKVQHAFKVYELQSSENGKTDWSTIALFKTVEDAQAALRLYVPGRILSIGWTTYHTSGNEDLHYHTYVDSRHWSIDERMIFQTLPVEAGE